MTPASSQAANADVPAIEVRLGNGRSLIIPAGFDETQLVKLIAAVERMA